MRAHELIKLKNYMRQYTRSKYFCHLLGGFQIFKTETGIQCMKEVTGILIVF